MTADASGNDLQSVDVPITGQLAIAPYAAGNMLTSEQGGGAKVTWPADNPYEWLGLIKSDGGATESQDQDDAIEFFQKGYVLNQDPTMSIQYGLAEFNRAVRKLITGQEPDANGMIPVDTYTPDSKWILFYEEVNKNGKIRRLNGVIQVTTTEVDQSERGSVKGRNVTMTWQPDPIVGNGSTTKFLEWQYDPTATPSAPTLKSIAVAPATGTATSVEVDKTLQLKATATYSDNSTKDVSATAAWASDTTDNATVDNKGLAKGVKEGSSNITAKVDDVTSPDFKLTVTAAS